MTNGPEFESLESRVLPSTIGLEMYPFHNTWTADGNTLQEVQVRINSRDMPTQKLRDIELAITVPSGLEGYFVGSSLPSLNNPSTNPDDIFYGFSMNPSYNRLDSTISGLELSDNVRDVLTSDGPQNKEGLFGSFFFRLDGSAPIGTNYMFDAHNVYMYGPDGTLVAYGPDEDGNYLNLSVTNHPFNVVSAPVPEPYTIFLVGSGAAAGIGLYERARMSRKEEEKKASN